MPRPNYGDASGNWHERPSAHASRPAEHKRERSREMRQDMSLPEVLFWQQIRGERLGLKFRRQHAIGPFFADFYCHELRLVVEIDGKYHDDQREQDARRTEWLEAQGYSVIRLSAQGVLQDAGLAASHLMQAIQRRFPNPTRIEAR